MLSPILSSGSPTPVPVAAPQVSIPTPASALRSELAQAARYVQALLPEPQSGIVETDWVFLPSAELGGDAFGYHWLDDEHFALYLFDVSGHSIGAALHSVSVLNVLRTQGLRGANFYAPGEVLSALNEAFPMQCYDNLFFTIWYGVYNARTRRLTYATGGHPPALLVTGGEGERLPQVERLRTRGPMIGGMRGMTFPSVTRTMPLGSSLYLFSDGIYEVRQGARTMMVLDDFEKLLLEQVAGGAGDVAGLMARMNTLRKCRTGLDDTVLLRVTFH